MHGSIFIRRGSYVVQTCVLSKGIADAPWICHSIDVLVYSQ